jgi:hypothetical protein
MLPPDRRDRRRHVLVDDREGPVDQGRVGERHLVEPQHRDAPAGQPPRQILERLVAADRLVPVVRAGAGEQHDADTVTLMWQAHRPGHGQRARPDRHVLLVER